MNRYLLRFLRRRYRRRHLSPLQIRQSWPGWARVGFYRAKDKKPILSAGEPWRYQN